MVISEVFATDEVNNNDVSSSFGASFANFIPLILIVLVFYFFIIRPHHKKLKEHKKMVDRIKRGDTVATSCGIIGIVNRVDDLNSHLLVEIAPKVEVKILKSSISQVLNNTVQYKEKADNQTEDSRKNKNQYNKGGKKVQASNNKNGSV